jgi:two-component system sensor histidine kinase RegB
VLFATEIAVVCLVWQLTTWMSKYLKDLRSNLQQLEHQKLRIDNLRAMGVMASSFCHELATPLNTIKLRLDRMKRQSVNISNDHDLMSASQGVEQCEMVLKKFFGAELESIDIQFDRVLIFDLIESACKKWLDSQVDKAIKLNIVVEEGARNTYCFIPSHLLIRSILDLLDNAKEASEVRSEDVQVTMYSKGKSAVIEIADRGPGVSNEIKNRLGTPFVSGKEHGSGLGLFSAYSLAEALGGSLELLDRPGGGAIVKLILPIKEQGD